MNQFDRKWYEFPRTTKQAFGGFLPMRKDVTFGSREPDSNTGDKVVFIVSVLIVLCSIFMP